MQIRFTPEEGMAVKAALIQRWYNEYYVGMVAMSPEEAKEFALKGEARLTILQDWVDANTDWSSKS
jgi:hypothetical protein